MGFDTKIKDVENATTLKTSKKTSNNNIDNKVNETKEDKETKENKENKENETKRKKGRPKGYKLKDEEETVKPTTFSLQRKVLKVLNDEAKKKQETRSKVLNDILKEYFEKKGMM